MHLNSYSLKIASNKLYVRMPLLDVKMKPFDSTSSLTMELEMSGQAIGTRQLKTTCINSTCGHFQLHTRRTCHGGQRL